MSRKKFSPLTPKMPGLLHGGDYNPEQWPPETWLEDTALMRKAHWNAITVGVFSWVSLEQEEGRFVFDWLDRIMDLQAEAGRVVGLATPSAAAPAWLSKKYPETLRTGADGVRRKHGNRVNYCWSSPVYRQKTREMAARLAERYKDHPALAYWHVSNEFGGQCYCELCQAGFRHWLRERYGSLEKLNQAYWARFWSHSFTDWDQIEAPVEPYGETSIIGLTLDWKRYTSDLIIDFYGNEASVLREITLSTPVTTNFMGTYPVIDLWKMAPHVDFVAWDSYPWFHSGPSDLQTWVYTSFCHDLNRSLRSGQPFLLMECSPSSSNWYPVMALKKPNAHKLEGLQAVAHGADGVQYFQWRQGRGSSEQFHGAVVAHNNREDARVFQEVAELGRVLEDLSEVAGATSAADVAIVYDWEVGWAVESLVAPARKQSYMKTVLAYYKPLWSAGLTVDMVSSESDLSAYKFVIAPMMTMLKPGVAERIAKFVEDGGTFLTTYWSGVVDESTLAFQGGYPEPLGKVLGIRCEETDALYDGHSNSVLTKGSGVLPTGAEYAATELCELIHVEGAEVLAVYGSDFYAGRPALTRNSYGKGHAFFVASQNAEPFQADLLTAICKSIDIESAATGTWPDGVTVQRRQTDRGEFLFVLNCTDREAPVALEGDSWGRALTGENAATSFVLEPFGSRVFFRSAGDAATEHVSAKTELVGTPSGT